MNRLGSPGRLSAVSWGALVGQLKRHKRSIRDIVVGLALLWILISAAMSIPAQAQLRLTGEFARSWDGDAPQMLSTIVIKFFQS